MAKQQMAVTVRRGRDSCVCDGPEERRLSKNKKRRRRLEREEERERGERKWGDKHTQLADGRKKKTEDGVKEIQVFFFFLEMPRLCSCRQITAPKW